MTDTSTFSFCLWYYSLFIVITFFKVIWPKIVPSLSIIVAFEAFFWSWKYHSDFLSFKLIVSKTMIYYKLLLKGFFRWLRIIICKESHCLIIFHQNFWVNYRAKSTKILAKIIFSCLYYHILYPIRKTKNNYFRFIFRLSWSKIISFIVSEIIGLISPSRIAAFEALSWSWNDDFYL